MKNHLVRITEDDFRDYRKWYSKIEYSDLTEDLEENGERHNVFTTITIMSRADFLDAVSSQMIEMYFMRNSLDETKGVATLSFREDKVCMINDFCVFERKVGLGMELYKLVCEKIQNRGYSQVEVWYPFGIALGFLKKIGLTRKKQGQNVFVGRIMALVQD